MSTYTTPDGSEIHYKNRPSGQPIVSSHGWPLTADAWEDQMFSSVSHGYRCIAADRRGHGRSSQPWDGNDLDTYADDLATLNEKLNLKGAIHVGHSTGGGEVARYIGRRGTKRVAGVVADRGQFIEDLSAPFYGANRPDATVSKGVRDLFYTQSMRAGMPASYFCIKAFSETDLTEDLKAIDVPTSIVHGSDDRIVPIAASALTSSKIVKRAQLKIYDGAPHGLPTTLEDRLSADLLEFVESVHVKEMHVSEDEFAPADAALSNGSR